MLISLFQGGLSLENFLAQILASVMVIFFVLPFHEWAHGFVAYKLGDNTAKYSGRLKFSPLAHIDPIGAACLLFLGIGWAKPVPVNPNYFKNPKKGMALTAAAGPAANILAGSAGILLYNIVNVIFSFVQVGAATQTIYMFLIYFLSYYITLNFFLAVFNLIPIPPLDGSKILGAFLPDHAMANMYRYERIFMTIFIVLIATNVLSWPINFVSNLLISGISWLIGLPFELFGFVAF